MNEIDYTASTWIQCMARHVEVRWPGDTIVVIVIEDHGVHGFIHVDVFDVHGVAWASGWYRARRTGPDVERPISWNRYDSLVHGPVWFRWSYHDPRGDA